MQLTCPNCGEHVPSDKVNIQKMVAVCPACDTVFAFEPPQEKAKRRKVKQPPQIIATESVDDVGLAFRTNFRLDQSEAFLSGVLLSICATVITLSWVIRAQSDDAPGLWLLVLSALVSLLTYYRLALLAFNKTHIEMNDERITVSRRPLPSPFNHIQNIGLADVVAVRCEETPVSKEKGFDTPRYHVWAETVDGRRKLIVSDVTEDYGLFIAQYLNEHLESDTDVDVSRLSDDESGTDSANLNDEISRSAPQPLKADRR